MRGVIIQRHVPPYCTPLFKRLHQELRLLPNGMVQAFRDLSAWWEQEKPDGTPRAQVSLVWDNFGPMHDDRCQALAKELGAPTSVVGIELYATSKEYDWKSSSGEGFTKLTLWNGSRGSRPSAIIKALRLFRTCHAAGSKNVFLCHYEQPDIFLAAILLRLFGHRVFTMGDMKFDDKPRHMSKEILKRAAMVPYHGAVAAGPRTADYMRFLGVAEDQIRLSYDNVSVDRLRSSTTRLPDTPYAERTILSIARFIPKKNHQTLIEAYAQYAAKAEQPRQLVLCGDGPLKSEICGQIKDLGIISNVEMLGFVDGPAAARELKRALCLVLPSTEEQFGIVIIEALALGIPVLISQNCGAADVAVRTAVNGFIVEPDNSEGIATILDVLSSNETFWKSLSQNAYDMSAKGDVKHFAVAVMSLCQLELQPTVINEVGHGAAEPAS